VAVYKNACRKYVAFTCRRTTVNEYSSVCVGVFCLLFAYATIVYIQSRLTRAEFRHFFFLAVMSAAGAVFLTVIGLTYAGENCVIDMLSKYNDVTTPETVRLLQHRSLH